MSSLLLSLLLIQSLQMPKNDPNGTWEAQTGTKFQLALKQSDLTVQIVPGSSSTYLEYELKLDGTDEPNTYEGSGFFVAKRGEKQCKFETHWRIVVVSPEVIFGSADRITPDFESCTVKERTSTRLDLKKKS
jgi:hypothetical protein